MGWEKVVVILPKGAWDVLYVISSFDELTLHMSEPINVSSQLELIIYRASVRNEEPGASCQRQLQWSQWL